MKTLNKLLVYYNKLFLMYIYLMFIMVFIFVLISCGKNIYEAYDKKSPEEEAAVELEKQNPQKAINILEKALSKDPKNVVYISLLSSAYAQKYGVDFLDIILAMAQAQTASNSDNPLMMLWPYLPSATSENIAGIKHSLELLNSIEVERRRDCDNFKLSLLAIIYTSISLKALDLNGDGALSIDEMANLTLDQAKDILLSIVEAALSVASISNFEEGNSKSASDLIVLVNEKINSQPGNNELEKLQNYLQNN